MRFNFEQTCNCNICVNAPVFKYKDKIHLIRAILQDDIIEQDVKIA
jgi:hypothetical protein